MAIMAVVTMGIMIASYGVLHDECIQCCSCSSGALCLQCSCKAAAAARLSSCRSIRCHPPHHILFLRSTPQASSCS